MIGSNNLRMNYEGDQSASDPNSFTPSMLMLGDPRGDGQYSDYFSISLVTTQ